MSAPVLLSYQQRWIADESQFKVAEKSRRIGLTWAEACDSVLFSSRASGDDVWYVGYNKEMALEFIETCGVWAKALNVAAGELEDFIFEDDGDKAIFAYRIRFLSGHKVTALSSRPSNLRGKQGRVVIDEAAFHDDLAELLKAALALLIWGGRVHVLSTHNGEENEFNRLVEKVRSGQRPGGLHRITFDDAIADGLYERICEVTKRAVTKAGKESWIAEIESIYGDDADEELRVIPARGGGQYIPLGIVERCSVVGIPVFRISRADDWSFVPEPERAREIDVWLREVRITLKGLPDDKIYDAGLDYGRMSDLGQMVLISREVDGTRRVALVVELARIPYAQQKQIWLSILLSVNKLGGVWMDAGGNGQTLAEETRDVIPGVEMVHLSQRFYAEQFPKLKTAFEDRSVQVPSDPELIADFKAVVKVGGNPAISTKRVSSVHQKVAKRHGDFAIALLLAFIASLEDTPSYEWYKVPKTRGEDGIALTSGIRFKGVEVYDPWKPAEE